MMEQYSPLLYCLSDISSHNFLDHLMNSNLYERYKFFDYRSEKELIAFFHSEILVFLPIQYIHPVYALFLSDDVF